MDLQVKEEARESEAESKLYFVGLRGRDFDH